MLEIKIDSSKNMSNKMSKSNGFVCNYKNNNIKHSINYELI